MKPKSNKIDFEIAKYKGKWFAQAKRLGWDDDIRDYGWKMIERDLRAARMRRAKVRRHDDARTLLKVSGAAGGNRQEPQK